MSAGLFLDAVKDPDGCRGVIPILCVCIVLLCSANFVTTVLTEE